LTGAETNGEVAKNKDQIISTSTGVTYSTDRGLYFIEGRTINDLTKLLKGTSNLNILAVDNYKLRLNHLNLAQIIDSLSTIDAKDYIFDAKITFDKQNNELLASSNSYEYFYVFNFESGYWHKINESYRILINNYPAILVQRENSSDDGIYSMSEEDLTRNVTIILTTRPCKT
jgi:hypothetical protein